MRAFVERDIKYNRIIINTMTFQDFYASGLLLLNIKKYLLPRRYADTPYRAVMRVDIYVIK